MAESSPATRVSGACLCGAVRFTAARPNQEVGACHCGMCRKWTAGVFFAVDCGDSLKVEDPSKLGVYRSSEWAERCFCKACGTPLFYRLVGQNLHFANAEAFDDRDGYTFASQIFIDEKPAYYAFANKTKTMTGAEVFAAFGPPDGAKA